MSCSNEDDRLLPVESTLSGNAKGRQVWQTLFARTPAKIVLPNEGPCGIRCVRPLPHRALA
jgi:hypothetical protein